MVEDNQDKEDELRQEKFEDTIMPENNDDDSIVSFEKPEIVSMDLDSATQLSEIIQETQKKVNKDSFSVDTFLAKDGSKIKGLPRGQLLNDETGKGTGNTSFISEFLDNVDDKMKENPESKKEEDPDAAFGSLSKKTTNDKPYIEPDEPIVPGLNTATKTKTEKDLKETQKDNFIEIMKENLTMMDEIIDYIKQNPDGRYEDLKKQQNIDQMGKQKELDKKEQKKIGKFKKYGLIVFGGAVCIYIGSLSLFSLFNKPNIKQKNPTGIERIIEEEKTVKSDTKEPTKEKSSLIKIIENYDLIYKVEIKKGEGEAYGIFEVRKYDTNRKGTNSKYTMHIQYINKQGKKRSSDFKFDTEATYKKMKKFLYEKECNLCLISRNSSYAYKKNNILPFLYVYLLHHKIKNGKVTPFN